MRKLTNEFLEELNSNKTWLKSSGIVLCIMGLVIILGSFFDFSLLLPISLSIVSVILFVHAFKFWFNKKNGFIISIFEGLIYLFMAVFFFKHFMLRVYVPLLLVCAFFVFGFFRIYAGFAQVFIYKGWAGTILSGIVTLLLSIVGMYYFIDSVETGEIILALSLNILFLGVSFIALGFDFNQPNRF